MFFSSILKKKNKNTTQARFFFFEDMKIRLNELTESSQVTFLKTMRYSSLEHACRACRMCIQPKTQAFNYEIYSPMEF
jgi:hypothetical protein